MHTIYKMIRTGCAHIKQPRVADNAMNKYFSKKTIFEQPFIFTKYFRTKSFCF